MAYASPSTDRLGNQGGGQLDRAARSDAMEWMARIGYAARGVVYVLLGILAVSAAFGNRETTGSRGALESLLEKPYGQILLALVAVGLAFFAIWRFVQAAADTEHKGTDGKGMALRAGYAFSGLINLALAFTALSLWLGWGGGNDGNWTASLMAQPFGQWLVGLAGVGVLIYGLYQVYRAYKVKLDRKLEFGKMSPQVQKASRFLGRAGIAARGVVFAILGWLLIQAAMRHDGERVGVEDALDTLAAQDHGKWLLAVVALGLVAYGLYQFVRARYRRIADQPA